jgi:tRNA A37 threonylcarbamoyladenosine biosynthesis protein TsaE
LQRLYYPFRASTLAKLRELMDDLRGNLALAIDVLDVDIGIQTLHKLDNLAVAAQSIADEVSAVQDQGVIVDYKLDGIAVESEKISTQLRDVKDHVLRADRSLGTLKGLGVSLADELAQMHLQSIISWLSPSAVNDKHREAATQKREQGTGQWLLDHPSYQAWKISSLPILWLSGKAGCGKTILSSTVIKDLESAAPMGATGSAQLVYYYFSFHEPDRQGLQQLLSSVAAQLCNLKPVFDRLRELQKSPKAQRPTTEQLQEVVLLALQHVTVYLVVDALDEVAEQDDKRQCVLEWIEQMASSQQRIKILATSRICSDIDATMTASKAVHIDIDRDVTDKDIKRYIANELARDKQLRHLGIDLKLRIEQVLSAKADGM